MISKESLDFIEDLKKNNDRDWFTANKKRFELVKEDYHRMIADLLEAMVPFDASLKSLEVKDCAFRIYRDIRFSKDKTPYKTHLGIWMSPGQKNTNLAGYYVHLEKGASFIAGGVYWPDADDLKKIRKEIAFFHEDLEQITGNKDFKSEFGGLDIEHKLKTMPKGYEKDHPAIEFLKLKSFTASSKIDDKLLSDKDFVKKISEKLALLKPLIQFLNRGLHQE